MHKFRIMSLLLVLGLLFSFSATNPAAAEETTPPSLPGWTEGTGIHFEVTDSEYMNVTLDSSVSVTLTLSSVPEIVSITIDADTSAGSAEFTLGGFAPNTLYYHYADEGFNPITFTTDAAGSFTFTQDLSEPHYVWFQTQPSTYYLRSTVTGGDCTSIGNWDFGTLTCTMTKDIYQTINIRNNGITLDGAGHYISYPGSYGVYSFAKTNLTIKNLNIIGATFGVFSQGSDYVTFKDLNIDSSYYGIVVAGGDNNTVSGNTLGGNGYGLYHSGASDNTTVRDNTFWGNATGMYFDGFGYNHQIYNNNFLSNTIQINYWYPNPTHVFNLAAPIGGNYFDDFDTPGEGCNPSPVPLDSFCDAPYELWRVYYTGYYIDVSGLDYLPWTTQDGWNVPTNNPPTADADYASVTVNEGDAAINTGTVSDPDGDTVTLNADVGTVTNNNDGTWSWNFPTSDGPAESQTVTIDADDGNGGTDQTTFNLTVNNVAPAATFGNNGPIDEGGSAMISFNGAFDPSSEDTTAGLHYAFDCSGGSLASATYATSGTSDSTNCTFADNGNYIVSAKIMDQDDGANEYSTSVAVNNVVPTLGAISVDQPLVTVGTAITANASFTDPGTNDTHTALWDWGDGTSAGSVTQGAGSGSVDDSHSYTIPGVYTIVLTVTDDDGGVGTSTFQFVVVYDPDGGFVTGGGWIWSPVGAYADDVSLEGKATFGFVSKYKKGATVPSGVTEFQFRLADLNFKSTSYEWLVVAGARAQFKGTGTINGEGDYQFMLTALDAHGNDNDAFEIDRFRIRIWYEDSEGNEIVVYDNGLGTDGEDDFALTEIGGGSIVIHNPKGK